MAGRRKKHSVDRTRLTWVLAILVAAMTIGTVVLGVMEPNQAFSTESTYLAATYNSDRTSKISRTDIPIEGERWHAVNIHLVGKDLKLRCLARGGKAPVPHFVISPDAEILITNQWANQKDIIGYRGMIHVGLQLPPSKREASLQQAESLVLLLKDLQARCKIQAGNIFLHGQLSNRLCQPDPLCRYNWRQVLLP